MVEEMKTGRRIILADGTTFENADCGYADGFLWNYIPGDLNLQETAMIFFDKTKTARIIYEYGEMSDEYTGMTELKQIAKDNTGMIRICLTKP